MGYIVVGYRTEKDARDGANATVVCHNTNFYDAVKISLKLVDTGDWFRCFVAKIVR